jgi:hypothetical protein
MMKNYLCTTAVLVSICATSALAQPAPPPTPTPPTMASAVALTKPTEIKSGVDLIAGDDKMMHLFIDGVRVGRVLLDPVWKGKLVGLTPIPPDYFEPPPTKPFPYPFPIPLPKPCGGPNVKCIPDPLKFNQLINLPKDFEKISVYAKK